MSRVPMGSDGPMLDGNNEKLRKKLFQALQRHQAIEHVHTAGNSSGIVDGAASS